MKKSLTVIICLISMLFTACGGEYRSDISCDGLCRSAVGVLEEKEGKYVPMGKEQLFLIFGEDEPYLDYGIFVSEKTEDIDEIGIFRSGSKETAEDTRKALEGYIKDTSEGMRSFVMSYAPDEARKLDNAEVLTFGNYAVYLILDKHDSERIKSEIEKQLKK